MNKLGAKPNGDSKFLRMQDAMGYYSLGRQTLTETAKKAGAIRKIGRCVLIDRQKLEHYIDTLGDREEVEDNGTY